MARRTVTNERPAIAIHGRRDYPGGYYDDDVEEYAREDGQSGVHDATRWGQNTQPHALDVLNAGHDSNAGLIAHGYRSSVQAVAANLEAELPEARSAEQTALDRLESWRSGQIGLIRLRHEIESKSLAVPAVRSLYWLVAGLAVLFFGETALISVGYQVFGLSDKPFIPFVQATDELHLAAYASVSGLLVLGHVAGHKLRLVAHDLEQRRLAVREGARAALPSVSIFNAAMIGVCSTAGVTILYGLSTIRVSYLRVQGADVQSLPFALIQVGMFSAAGLLSYIHAHPYARQWSDCKREAEAAEKSWHRADGAFNSLVATVNANIDQLDTLLAQAGHHVGVSESDVRRQGALYARRVVLSQPEPVDERMFSELLPQPTAREADDLTSFLIGVTPVLSAERLTTDVLVKRRDEIRAELRELGETLSAIRFSGELVKEFGELEGELR